MNVNLRFQICLLLACFLNCCDDGHANEIKQKQSCERLQFMNDFFGNGHTTQIAHDELIHNARVTTDSSIAVISYYQMIYHKDVKYRLRVFKQTQEKSGKSKRKMAIEAVKILVGIMTLTDSLAYVILACKDQNGKVSTFLTSVCEF